MFIYFDNKWKKYLKYLVFLSKCIPCIFAHFQFQVYGEFKHTTGMAHLRIQFQGYQSCNYFASAAVLCPQTPPQILCHISDYDLIIFILYHVFYTSIFCVCALVSFHEDNRKCVDDTPFFCKFIFPQLIIPPQSLSITYVYHKRKLLLV